MALGDQPFVGSEALASGLVKKHQLRTHFRTVYPDVYVSKGAMRRPSRPMMCLQSLIGIAVLADSVSYAPRSTYTIPARNRRRKRGCGSW